MSFIESFIAKFLGGSKSGKEITKKSGLALLLKTGGLGLNYVFLFLVTSAYNAEGWGIFTLCFSVLNTCSLVAALGIDVAYVKLFASPNVNTKALYNKGLGIITSLAILLSAMVYFGAGYLAMLFDSGEATIAIFKITSFSILPSTLLYYHAGIFRGLGNVSSYIIYDGVGRFALAVPIIFILSYYELGISIPVLGFTISLTLLSLISFIHLWKGKYLIHGDQDKLKVFTNAELYELSLPLFWGNFASKGFRWMIAIIIGAFLTSEEVGIYDGCARLSGVVLMIGFAVNSIIAPKISAAYQAGNQAEVQNVLNLGIKLLLILSIPVFVFILLTGNWLLALLGEEYTGLYLLLIAFMVGDFVANILSVAASYMQMTGLHKVHRNVTLIVLAVGSVFQAAITAGFGLSGAVLATSMIKVFRGSAFSYATYSRRKVRTWYYIKSSKIEGDK